jgi:sec-independent protein translocase protein TatA
VPFGIGPMELIIVLVVLLLLFGAKRLPEIGRNLGSGAREFKEGITGGGKREPDEEPDALPKPQDREQV